MAEVDSVPTVGAAIADDRGVGPSGNRIYGARAATQWRKAAISLGMGLLGLAILRWPQVGSIPGSWAAVALCLGLPSSILFALDALRGLPRLTITSEGVTLVRSLGSQWVHWASLDPFEVKNIYAGQIRREKLKATAKVSGTAASRRLLWAGQLSLSDEFTTPIRAIADELNLTRAKALGTSGSLLLPEPELPVGVADFKLPWLTFALLAVLVGAYILEIVLPAAPKIEIEPSVATLFALGGLSRSAVFAGEWYRLFTAPLLHGNLVHIIGNATALVLGGWLLERFIGRLWFFAFFVVGALGGSLMSLAVAPPNLISVGASGALMAMFAAVLVGSFRLAWGSAAQKGLQMNSLQVLIPSLLPLASSAAGAQIDYGAHFGGAISGAALATVLLKFWPKSERLPQLRNVATAVSVIGAVAILVSIGMALANYPKYDIAVIPQSELPNNPWDRQDRAAELTARYPHDPRSHILLAEKLEIARDYEGAERELRVAWRDAQQHSAMFDVRLELIVRGTLAMFLAQHGKLQEAKDIAQPTCSSVGDKNLEDFVKQMAGRGLCN